MGSSMTPDEGDKVSGVGRGDGYSRRSLSDRRSSPRLVAGGRRDAARRVRFFAAATPAVDSCSSGSSGSNDSSGSSSSSDKGPLAAHNSKSGGATAGQADPKGDGDGDGAGDVYVRVAKEHVTTFLRTALLMLHVCMGRGDRDDGNGEDAQKGNRVTVGPFPMYGLTAGRSLGADGSELPASDDEFTSLCRFFAFPESAEAMLSDPGIVSAARR